MLKIYLNKITVSDSRKITEMESARLSIAELHRLGGINFKSQHWENRKASKFTVMFLSNIPPIDLNNHKIGFIWEHMALQRI